MFLTHRIERNGGDVYGFLMNSQKYFFVIFVNAFRSLLLILLLYILSHVMLRFVKLENFITLHFVSTVHFVNYSGRVR